MPPRLAAWIPAGVEHCVIPKRQCEVMVLYADPGQVDVPNEGHLVALDPLARELLRVVATFEGAYEPGTPEGRLIAVLLDRLLRIDARPVQIPHPVDERLQRLCAMLEADPGDRRTLDELASEAGMSGRTANRLFQQEMHLTFAHWRQQVRLLAALELLGAGESVTRVSHAIGYRDVSAFIAMFRSATGTSPARYFGRRDRGDT
ncbi:MAG: AraC family transcriptional regulator [Thermomicrobiales bacterium]|nr:AraC family transcriptional regulator [Thermomicrobiales bacterium]